jgi:cytochrome oxidase Cu insertion factor (SCO1/SenC/PrrC family)
MPTRWITLLLFFLCLSLAAAQEVRTWTSASGKTIEAAFVEQKYGQVILQPPAGEQIKINLNQLSSADQIYVGSQGKPKYDGTTSATMVTTSEKTIPPELEALFGKRLVNAKGKKCSTAELTGKKIGIYFSASWCPPCRAFTPQLVAAYNQLQTEGKPFEVVLVTSDKDEASMKAYMKRHDMPWLAIPFGEKQIDALKKKYSVAGIPMLVVVDATGKTLSDKARGEVMQDGAKAYDAW